MKIKVHNPNNLPLIDYRKLTPFQGNLKILTDVNYEKGLKSLKENGFFVPFFVWRHEGTDYTMDGHQRTRIMERAKITPYKMPFIEIKAETVEEAKKKLLVIASQYGTVTEEGFQEFTAELDDEWLMEAVSFDNIFTPVELPDPEPKKKKTERDIHVNTEVLEEYQELAGYKTAIERPEGSLPITFLREHDFLKGEVLDYGCGREQHPEIMGFDPYYNAHYNLLEHQYDVVTCNYVLNIIPLKHNRFELIRVVYSLLKPGGKAYFSIWGKDSIDTHTSSGFQSGWSKDQWLEFISQFYPCQEIPADFWLFVITKPK